MRPSNMRANRGALNGKSAIASGTLPLELRQVETMPTVFRGPVQIYHDQKRDAFKIELGFGDPDFDQILDARKREFDRWIDEQYALLGK